jgi:hypothetical protein
MRVWFALFFPTFLLGCGSSTSSTASPTVTLSTTTSRGETMYTCQGGGGISLDHGALFVECDFGDARAESALLEVSGYHGSGMYPFTCDNPSPSQQCDANAVGGNEVWLPMGDYTMAAWPASPGVPASSCTFTIQGSSSLSRGNPVSGTFHCDPIALVVGGSSLDASPLPTSVDGQFQGTFD